MNASRPMNPTILSPGDDIATPSRRMVLGGLGCACVLAAAGAALLGPSQAEARVPTSPVEPGPALPEGSTAGGASAPPEDRLAAADPPNPVNDAADLTDVSAQPWRRRRRRWWRRRRRQFRRVCRRFWRRGRPVRVCRTVRW
jgi:hypothetical protein